MVDYRRMGNMVRQLVNTTSTTFMNHHPSDLWKSPRWTVIRIQALAIVAIIITFLVVAFGSCRRWSNRWIVQKGFFAAQVLSLSLGTYSIGVMQSSSVKSEMYPIWSVSLFTLFGCVDPVTSYNGLDYKGPLSKVVYGICLYCGYVLLMSILSISSGLGNAAIGLLTALTFIKGFHRSMALVQQSIMRNLVEVVERNLVGVVDYDGDTCVLRYDYHLPRDGRKRIVDFPTTSKFTGVWREVEDAVLLDKVDTIVRENDELQSCYDACVAYCLSHRLHRHFVWLTSSVTKGIIRIPKGIKYRRALKVVEIELAFLYEVFFSGNAFLHYYQAKTASLWTLASLIGICFLGVAAAIPGTMRSRHNTSDPGSCTKTVGTTTADVVITFVILASLILLQLVQLIRCWTSNWARLAVVCAYARTPREKGIIGFLRAHWLKLKAFVATSNNWSDNYLWQDKIGQYSILILPEELGRPTWESRDRWGHVHPRSRCVRLVNMLGLNYFWKVVRDVLGSDPNKGAIRLDDDVKDSIIDFLGKIESDRLDGNWLSFLDIPHIEDFLPYSRVPEFEGASKDCRYTECLRMWYVVTWYCEVEEQERERGSSIGCWRTTASYLKNAVEPVAGCFGKGARGGEENQNRHRHVANALSKYCTYLMVSVPELLAGPAVDTRWAYNNFMKDTLFLQINNRDEALKFVLNRWSDIYEFDINDPNYHGAPIVAMMRSPDRWKMLVDVWVRMLVYAAPCGNVEVHMRQLSQGGEFITHLWALLYHLGIREWKPQSNLHDLTSIDDARRIRAELFHEKGCTLTQEAVVVAFLDSLSGSSSGELAAASELEERVIFYRITCPKIAELFNINPAANIPSLVLKKEDDEIMLYDGEFSRYAIAAFLSANKLPLVTTLRRRTVSSLKDHPIQKMIILLAVKSDSLKFLPNFKEAAKSFVGKLLFVFVERDNSEAREAVDNLLLDLIRETQQAATNLLDRSSTGQQETTMEVQQVTKDKYGSTLIGQETKVLISTRYGKRRFQIIGEVSLHNIKKIAQAFFEDKLYMSEPLQESNDEGVKTIVGKNIDQIVFDESKDVLLVISTFSDPWNGGTLDPYAKLAKHMGGIDSLVIARMDGNINWHPRVQLQLQHRKRLHTLFYPAKRKRFEPITFHDEKPSVQGLYKFIKKHAGIPFKPISTLEERSLENEPISTLEERSPENRQTEHEIEEL